MRSSYNQEHQHHHNSNAEVWTLPYQSLFCLFPKRMYTSLLCSVDLLWHNSHPHSVSCEYLCLVPTRPISLLLSVVLLTSYGVCSWCCSNECLDLKMPVDHKVLLFQKENPATMREWRFLFVLNINLTKTEHKLT